MKRWMTMMLAAVLLLSGCVAAPGTTEVQLGSKPTVEDLFSPSAVTAPTTVGASEPGATAATDATESTTSKPPIDWGRTSLGPVGGDTLEDEYGVYRLYEGGEVCMPFKLGAEGMANPSYSQNGVGIMLFLDGQAQPYSLEPGGELRYCHVIYPEFDPETNIYDFNICFTPVTGEKGDMLEFYYTTIPGPNWQTSDPETPYRYTFTTCRGGTRLKLNVTPPKAEKPEVTERINSVDISYVDTAYSEIAGWSDQELLQKYKLAWYINGGYPKRGNGYMYNCTASDSVELRFEIWGTPYVKYGLMFYIDNQPITAQQEILFDMKNGQKTVITIMIDLSDYDGECAVYAVLIPRNARSAEILSYAFLECTKTYFMLDDPEPADY